MPVDHREIAFEEAIEQSLVADGAYSKADASDFDRERAVDPTVLIPFLKETQPKEWAALEKLHGDCSETIILEHFQE